MMRLPCLDAVDFSKIESNSLPKYEHGSMEVSSATTIAPVIQGVHYTLILDQYIARSYLTEGSRKSSLLVVPARSTDLLGFIYRMRVIFACKQNCLMNSYFMDNSTTSNKHGNFMIPVLVLSLCVSLL